MLTVGQKLQIDHDRVVWSVTDDGAVVIFEMWTSAVVTLNGAAKLLWENLEYGASAAEMADSLMSAFGIPYDQARIDVESFILNVAELALVSTTG